ncbi:MAG: heme ABC transporter ATP-binding protein [Bacteroidota bacterium]
MIRTEHITVTVPSGKTLLEDVSVFLRPGEITAVIGKNGAGKSTLLKAITGNIAIKTGDIWYGEQVFSPDIQTQLAKVRAVVSQNVQLNFAFTVQEVVNIGRSPHSGFFGSMEDERIVRACLEQVDATHLADRDYTTLSGGEQQRVHIARALAQIWESVHGDNMGYLLLDEPLASLDISHQHQILDLLQSIAKNGVTVLIIIHDLNLAAQYSDQIIALKQGVVLASGAPEEVVKPTTISTAFDYPVQILPHPQSGHPMVIPVTRPA